MLIFQGVTTPYMQPCIKLKSKHFNQISFNYIFNIFPMQIFKVHLWNNDMFKCAPKHLLEVDF